MHVQHSLPQSRGPAGVAPVLLTPLATPAPWPWACSATSALGCTEDEMPADFGASPPPSPVVAAVQTVLAATPQWAVPAAGLHQLLPIARNPKSGSQALLNQQLDVADAGIHVAFHRLPGGPKTTLSSQDATQNSPASPQPPQPKELTPT
jgi:hypothetical protein